jgi:hypothetical protein
MNFSSKVVTMQKEIFKRKTEGDWTKEITLDFTAVVANSDGQYIVKAGSPISAAGVVDNATAPIGILLSDVYKERPIGTIITHGIVNLANCNSNSGLTIAAAVKTALPLISFE